MLCVRFSISCRHALSQTRREARIRRCSLVFDSPGRTNLPGTSRHSCVHIRSRQSLLIRPSGNHEFTRPLSGESERGDYWVNRAVVPAALDGHPPDVHPLLVADTCRILGSPTLGME